MVCKGKVCKGSVDILSELYPVIHLKGKVCKG